MAEFRELGRRVIAPVTVVASETLVGIPDELLKLSQKLIDQNEHSVAIVVAHTACEVSVENALSRAYAARRLQDIEEAVNAFLTGGYNLGNERIRKLYDALTGNEVQKEPFWEAFKKSSERRNKAVHKGIKFTQVEAEESFKAATDLIGYLRSK